MMRLVVLDPGHFHAALLQKTMYPGVDATVHVYAEDGPDLADYLQKIDGYNTRRKTRPRGELSSIPAPTSSTASARNAPVTSS